MLTIQSDYQQTQQRENAPSVEVGLVQSSQFAPPIPRVSGLSQTEETIAWLDAFGLPPVVIEAQLGVGSGTVITVRAKAEYRIFLKECLKVKAQSTIDAATDPEELFNDQISASVAALIEVRDDPFSKGGDRVKAATEFLNRAPKAPKAKTEVESKRTIITLRADDLKVMQQALIEEGSPADLETVELLQQGDGGYAVKDDGSH